MIWQIPYIGKNYINSNMYILNKHILSQPLNNNTFLRPIIDSYGKDFRYNNTEPDFDPSIYKKYELLQQLSSKESVTKKMELLHTNSYLFNFYMIYNITAGGLFDDYEFDFF